MPDAQRFGLNTRQARFFEVTSLLKWSKPRYKQMTFLTPGCQVLSFLYENSIWHMALAFIWFCSTFPTCDESSLLKWAYLTRPLNLKYPGLPGSSIFWYCVKNCAQIGICLIHIPLSCGSLHFVTASNKTNRPMGFRFYPFLSFLPQTEISRLLVTFSINYLWYETRYYGWWISRDSWIAVPN